LDYRVKRKIIVTLAIFSLAKRKKISNLCHEVLKVPMTSYAQTRDFLVDLYASYTKGDMGPTLEALADDIVFEYVGPPDIFPFCGIRHGKAQMLEAVGAIAAAFDVVSLSVKRVLVDDQGYVVILDAQFRNKDTGIIMACELVDVARIKGDKIVELREYWDVESATQQLMGKKLMLSDVVAH
jgi:ketosteroid isomerase-like protein